MPGANLHLKLDVALAAKLRRIAESAAMSREDLAAMLLEQALFDYSEFDWFSDPNCPIDPADADGEPLEIQQVVQAFFAEVSGQAD